MAHSPVINSLTNQLIAISYCQAWVLLMLYHVEDDTHYVPQTIQSRGAEFTAADTGVGDVSAVEWSRVRSLHGQSAGGLVHAAQPDEHQVSR